MRLGLKLLNVGASINSHKAVDFVRIARGENLDIVFQLIDLDQNGLRYIPPAGTTVKVTIARPNEPQYNLTTGQRETINKTIERAAAPAFGTDDRSIWKLPLVPGDTTQLISNSIRVELTESSSTKIAYLNQAIKIIDGQES